MLVMSVYLEARGIPPLPFLLRLQRVLVMVLFQGYDDAGFSAKDRAGHCLEYR